MTNWLKRNIFYIAFKDILNFYRFRKDIKAEKENPNSKFNRFKLKTNWLGNCIYTQKVLSPTQMMNNFEQKYIYLLDQTRGENDYFNNDLMWGEYLTFDTYNFVDENEGETNTYGIIWKFTPFALGSAKLFWGVILVCGFTIGVMSLLFKYGIL